MMEAWRSEETETAEEKRAFHLLRSAFDDSQRRELSHHTQDRSEVATGRVKKKNHSCASIKRCGPIHKCLMKAPAAQRGVGLSE